MCTILSVDKRFWKQNRNQVLATINLDANWNNHGWSLVCLDGLDEDNAIRLQSMKLRPITRAIISFFDSASDEARIFLHARYATTNYVGIGFNHGFDDRDGRIIMHNGILRNGVQGLAVDSFLLAEMDLRKADQVLEELVYAGETYANIFIIDSVLHSYSVLRLEVGSLFTDGKGNYASTETGPIALPVGQITAKTHYMMVAEDYIDEPEEEIIADEFDLDRNFKRLLWEEEQKEIEWELRKHFG